MCAVGTPSQLEELTAIGEALRDADARPLFGIDSELNWYSYKTDGKILSGRVGRMSTRTYIEATHDGPPNNVGL